VFRTGLIFNLLILQLLILFIKSMLVLFILKINYKKTKSRETNVIVAKSHFSYKYQFTMKKKKGKKIMWEGREFEGFWKGGETQINPKLNSSTWKLSPPSFFILFSSRNQLATPPFEKTRALLPPRDSPKKPHRRSPSLCQTRAAAHWHRRPAL